METPDVLVVDDDETIRQLYADAFAIAKISALTAKNGAEALQLALTHHPTVILVDILMPDMNGHELVEKLRTDRWGKQVKVIYLTNLSEPEHVVKAFTQKPEKYIVKSNTDIKDVVNQVRIAMHESG